MVLALALHLDPVYVGAHHLARFLVVTLLGRVSAAWPRTPLQAGRRRRQLTSKHRSGRIDGSP